MLAAFDNRPPEGAPPIEELITEPPERWQGLPLEWKKKVTPRPVYLDRYTVGAADQGHWAYLFGARYELPDVLVAGEGLGEGHFLEYLVARKGPVGGWAVARLLQQTSVTYSDTDERADYVPLRKVKDPASASVADPPTWVEPGEAVWPVYQGQPMRFVGQVTLSENDVTRRFLSWGVTAYLFESHNSGNARLKVVEQRTNPQSLAEHYREEERRSTAW